MKDFEVDLSDLFGDIVSKKEKKDEYDLILERLSSYCNKNWICVPYIIGNTTYLEIEEVENSSNELFFEWMLHIWASVKKLNHKPSDYTSSESKLIAWKLLIANHSLLNFGFNNKQ